MKDCLNRTYYVKPEDELIYQDLINRRKIEKEYAYNEFVKDCCSISLEKLKELLLKEIEDKYRESDIILSMPLRKMKYKNKEYEISLISNENREELLYHIFSLIYFTLPALKKITYYEKNNKI